MKIKVCGNTDLDQLKQLNDWEIDFAGLVFYQQSPRYLSNKISAEEISKADWNFIKVGVFVNESEEEIMQQVANYKLDMVQLHGDETASFCNRISDQIKVIKAFRLADLDTNVDWLVKEYDEVCDYYLFDKGSAGLYGGTGKKFDWNLLKESKISKPFFLSGGIERGDAQAIKKFSHPFFFGIDINSRFEISPGIKDLKLIKEFITELR